MTTKFDPFQQVLVRNRNYHPWEPMHYGYAKDGEHVCAGNPYQQCLPYTPETAHLLGTSQPYEPPKPPQEYEWGQKVEVFYNGEWSKGIYVHPIVETARWHSVFVGTNKIAFIETDIRPLPDDTAAH